MNRQQQGYTIVELLVAMAIFSFMSLILATGVVRLYQIYQAGVSIRVTQQAARTIAAKITRDAQTATVEVAGSGPGGTTTYNSLCMLTSQIVNNTQTLSGPEYFVKGVGGYDPHANQVQLWEVQVQFSASLTQAQLENACVPPATTAGAQQISSNDTTVLLLTGNDQGNGSMLAGKLSVAGMLDLGSIALPITSSGGVCNGGTAARYCSVTTLDVTAGPSGGTYEAE